MKFMFWNINGGLKNLGQLEQGQENLATREAMLEGDFVAQSMDLKQL